MHVKLNQYDVDFGLNYFRFTFQKLFLKEKGKIGILIPTKKKITLALIQHTQACNFVNNC